LQRIKGHSPLWQSPDVAEWLMNNGRLKEGDQIVQNARTLSKWNLALRNSVSKDFNEIEQIAEKLIKRRKDIAKCA
ncbi:DNA-binding protein, partial [Escherichia coli]